jgi:hypothetical protein
MSYNNTSYSGHSRPAAGRSQHSSFGGRSSGGRSGGGSRRPAKQYINPSRFIQAAKPAVEVIPYVPTHSFADFNYNQLLKDNIAMKGYVTPSPIQDQTIPLGLSGKDIVGIANTGTGKTAAFALPTLHRLMDDHSSKALIMAPTRELAQQIEDELRSIAKGSGLSSAMLIGGSPMGPQLRDLRGNPNVVIGTPGRKLTACLTWASSLTSASSSTNSQRRDNHFSSRLLWIRRSQT